MLLLLMSLVVGAWVTSAQAVEIVLRPATTTSACAVHEFWTHGDLMEGMLFTLGADEGDMSSATAATNL